jgi:hypothetical protein
MLAVVPVPGLATTACSAPSVYACIACMTSDTPVLSVPKVRITTANLRPCLRRRARCTARICAPRQVRCARVQPPFPEETGFRRGARCTARLGLGASRQARCARAAAVPIPLGPRARHFVFVLFVCYVVYWLLSVVYWLLSVGCCLVSSGCCLLSSGCCLLYICSPCTDPSGADARSSPCRGLLSSPLVVCQRPLLLVVLLLLLLLLLGVLSADVPRAQVHRCRLHATLITQVWSFPISNCVGGKSQ